MYDTNYAFSINGSKLRQVAHGACFSTLFSNLHNNDVIKGRLLIRMYPDLHSQHDLIFTKGEIECVFSRLSETIDFPVIAVIKNGLRIKFDLANKSSSYIKTVATLSRYFYEKEDGDSNRLDYSSIMRASIDFSKVNPDVPFIEVLQLFHYDTKYIQGHALCESYANEYPVTIISDKRFNDRMKDKSLTSIYGKDGIFTGLIHNKIANSDKYLDNLDKVKRI